MLTYECVLLLLLLLLLLPLTGSGDTKHVVDTEGRCSLEAGPKRKKNCVRFSICACHPCAGAMLIFSVSFQF